MLLRTIRSARIEGKWPLLAQLRSYVSAPTGSVLDEAAKDGELRVFLVAGEVSGDTIGSRLMSSLKKLSPFPLRFSGVGGSLMRKEGLESIFPMEDISVMGIWELLPHLYKFRVSKTIIGNPKAMSFWGLHPGCVELHRVRLRETVKKALLFQPHVVVTVDSKGFSFRFLKQLRGGNIRMNCNLFSETGEVVVFAARYGAQKGLNSAVHFHYVAPSFWAWKGGEVRLKGLADFVDHMFCILPNEDVVCRLHGLVATFVGHPVMEDVLELNLGKVTSPHEWKIEGNAQDFLCTHANPSGAMIVSVLPGSRLQEISRMLPIFKSTMEQLKEFFPELVTVVHVAPNQHVERYISGVMHKWPVPNILVPGGNPRLKYDAFSISRVALCTSGTVALELQLARLPCVVAYRAHILTEWFIKYKAKIPYISLPNILMDSPTIPEALFQDCTPDNLASLLIELINTKELQQEQVAGAEKVTGLLFPSESINITERKFNNCSPSMIAASTILRHVRS